MPLLRANDTVPHVIADYDEAGEVVGVQLIGLGRETLSLAAEFLQLVELPVPASLARTIDGYVFA
jgi:hypothetical protein